jgi:leucyl aminopeptidase (aminopeptidase T)
LGFGHHGIGSNYAIGGMVAAPCHIDVIYSHASMEVDGRLLMDKGKILI